MNDELAREIEQRLANGYWGAAVDGYRCVEAERHVRALLQERAQLLQLMTEVADMGVLKPDAFTFGHAAAQMTYMRDKLRSAVAQAREGRAE